MRSRKQEIASARNWCKYILAGAAANLRSPVYDNYAGDAVEILTGVERERMQKAYEQLTELVEHWDKGTEKVMNQYT